MRFKEQCGPMAFCHNLTVDLTKQENWGKKIGNYRREPRISLSCYFLTSIKSSSNEPSFFELIELAFNLTCLK